MCARARVCGDVCLSLCAATSSACRCCSARSEADPDCCASRSAACSSATLVRSAAACGHLSDSLWTRHGHVQPSPPSAAASAPAACAAARASSASRAAAASSAAWLSPPSGGWARAGGEEQEGTLEKGTCLPPPPPPEPPPSLPAPNSAATRVDWGGGPASLVAAPCSGNGKFSLCVSLPIAAAERRRPGQHGGTRVCETEPADRGPCLCARVCAAPLWRSLAPQRPSTVLARVVSVFYKCLSFATQAAPAARAMAAAASPDR